MVTGDTGVSVKLLDSSGKETSSSGILPAGIYYAQVAGTLSNSVYSLTLSPEMLKQFGTSNDDKGRSIAVNQTGLVSVVESLETPQGDTDGFLRLSTVSEFSASA